MTILVLTSPNNDTETFRVSSCPKHHPKVTVFDDARMRVNIFQITPWSYKWIISRDMFVTWCFTHQTVLCWKFPYTTCFKMLQNNMPPLIDVCTDDCKTTNLQNVSFARLKCVFWPWHLSGRLYTFYICTFCCTLLY